MKEVYHYLIQQLQMLGFKVMKAKDGSLVLTDLVTNEKHTLVTVKEVIGFIWARR